MPGVVGHVEDVECCLGSLVHLQVKKRLVCAKLHHNMHWGIQGGGGL